MPHDFTRYAKYHSLSIQGDLGPITFYTDQRGQTVWYLRAPPLNPPTPIQLVIRARFESAAANWRALSSAERDAWLVLADACNLGITGYNLWTYFSIAPNFEGLTPLEQRAGFTVTRPPQV